MHPDRRREGRAIRKQRREGYFATKDRQMEYITSGQFARDCKTISEGAARAFEILGQSLLEVARLFSSIGGTPLTQNQVALPPSPGALRRSEGGVLSPTHSEVEALRSPRGASIPLAWIDETHRLEIRPDDEQTH